MLPKKNISHFFIKMLSVFFWIIIWHIISKIINQDFLLASPVKVVKQLSTYFFEIFFWKIVTTSFFSILKGFLIATFTGVLSAVLSYRFRLIKLLLEPLMAAVKSVTTASVIILFLVWSKPSGLSVTVTVFMAFPIIYTSVLQGLSEVNADILEMAEIFRIPLRKKIIYIYTAQVMPFFESAGTASLGLAWKAGIAAEVIGLPPETIGLKLYEAKIYLNSVDLFSWTVVIIILGFLTEKLFTTAIRLFMGKIERKNYEH